MIGGPIPTIELQAPKPVNESLRTHGQVQAPTHVNEFLRTISPTPVNESFLTHAQVQAPTPVNEFPRTTTESSPSYEVLVVDDSNLNRKMLIKCLEAKHHICDNAVHGLQVLKQA